MMAVMLRHCCLKLGDDKKSSDKNGKKMEYERKNQRRVEGVYISELESIIRVDL